MVEWLNVSEGESSPDWDYLNPMLMRDGYAYVGVTAQALAVHGGTPHPRHHKGQWSPGGRSGPGDRMDW